MLNAQQIADVQENFTYSTSNLNGHAPSSQIWGGVWSTSVNNAVISTNGAQALISANGGTPGAGTATGNFYFWAHPNTFYTLRASFTYSRLGSSTDCWAGLGFADPSGTNMEPWMLIRPQVLSTDNPGTGFCVNNSWINGPTCPAANYSAPITMTITWNTTTGVVSYYIDDILQCTGSRIITTDPYPMNFFFEGFKTGNVVNLNTISVTSQMIWNLPEAWFSPTLNSSNFSTIIDSGNCGWSTARSHTQVWNIYDDQFTNNLTAAQRITFINYLIAHGIKLAICIQPLVYVQSNSCTHYEGFADPSIHTTAISNLKTAIAGCSNPSWAPSYISLDSPLCDCEKIGSCNMPIATAASQTATSIGYFKQAWGGIQVVQYDGLESFPQADVSSWFTAMKNNGQPINGIIDDFSWYFSTTSQLSTAASTCASSGVAFGMFYDGFSGAIGGNTNGNDAMYALGMQINLQCYFASPLPSPARVEVATWGGPAPCAGVCPETAWNTLSHLMNLDLTSPYVVQVPPVPLDVVTGNGYYNRYTNSYSEYAGWLNSGYTGCGSLGGISVNRTNSGIQGLVPIYLYCNTVQNPNQYGLSLNAADSDLNSYGYYQQSTLGYLFPAGNGAAMGGIPLHGAHKYVGPVNQYMYSNSPYTNLDDTFNPNHDYTKRLNSGNPIGYVLPGFFHNGCSNNKPY